MTRTAQRRMQAEKEERFIPSGTLGGSFALLHQAGCIQTGADSIQDVVDAASFSLIFAALMMETNNNPCNGCPALNGGACEAYQKFHSQPAMEALQKRRVRTHKEAITAPGTEKYPAMSMKKIALQLGISLSEARRRKAAGSL